MYPVISTFCVPFRKNALLIQIVVKIVWDKVDRMNGSWDMYLLFPTDFAGEDEIITKHHHHQRRESLVTSNALPNL